ncbi:MAG TPA: hypothetical protein VFN85_10560 [Solirubrobacterales bacterium]|nr:hypothetical protein [Solirubrobacterales bacterium]
MTIALALLLAVPSIAAAKDKQVVLAWLPSDTTVAQLTHAGFSPGVMSAGLGTVPPLQTYLDVGQGNRVFDSLYDRPLPEHRNGVRWLLEVVERAESAPADVVPFLLKKTLRENHVRSQFAEIARASLDRLPPRGSYRLLIAIAWPTGESDEPVPIGIAGRGFHGNLTSDSTRTDGYVLSTDVAPTILEHFGIPVPSAMSGQPIRSEGAVDPAAIESLVERMDVVSSRRGPVIGLNVVVWLVALLLVALLSRGRLARAGVRVVGLAIVYLPLVLLLGAALEPGESAERLLVLLLSPLLAALTLVALRGYRALAVASALTVLAYSLDVIAGSPLTSLSLLGPNPGLGVRFYGIGNELEALLAVLVVAGAGAGLTGFARSAAARTRAVVFLSVGLLAAFVFAAGRFGADVGAAIVFPVGAVVAAVVVAGRGRRTAILAVIAAPLTVLALLALIDLVSGANAHLTRSVLDAGGFGDLGDVAQRRLQLSAHSFGRPVLLAFLPVVLAIVVIAYLRRDTLRSWLEGRPAMKAGLLGALAATVIGALANDSGALLLEIGAAYLLVFTAFAWAESDGNSGKAAHQTKSYTSVTQI